MSQSKPARAATKPPSAKAPTPRVTNHTRTTNQPPSTRPKTRPAATRTIVSPARPKVLPRQTVPKNVPKKAAPLAPAPAARQGNWISQIVQNSIAGAGNAAGGFVNSIGDSVNKVGQGVGESITGATRKWGQGVADYGNNIKDSVGVSGPRVATGANPLGIASRNAPPKPDKAGLPARGAVMRKQGTAANPLGL